MFFFTEQVLIHNFQLINGFNTESRFLERLTMCAQNISEEAFVQRKRNKCIGEMQNHQNLNATAFRLLPFLLKDKNTFFFYQICSLETDINIAKMSGPQTLYVLALGDINDDCLCSISVENEDVISVHAFLKAIMLMFFMYYCCNMQYPLESARS